MVTAADVALYRQQVDGLSTLAFRDMNAVLQAIDSPNPIAVRDILLEAADDLLVPYITASGELSAAWYEDLRSASVGGRFYATVPDTLPTRGRIEALVRYAVSPLFGQSESTVLSLLGGGAQRLVANSGRDTIRHNITRDPVRVGYARVPQGGCCAFCGMLASRGATYRSEAAAGGVVGRGMDEALTKGKRGGQAKGVKARGNQGLGDKYHDHCRCVVTPVFVGDTYATEVQNKYLEMYRETDGLVDGKTNAKATLASWRQEHGTK